MTTSMSLVVVVDGKKFSNSTESGTALIAVVPVGQRNGTEQAQGIAVDEERNLIYVTRYSFTELGSSSSRNALIVIRGPEIDIMLRIVRRKPVLISRITDISLEYGGGRREIALDIRPGQNLIYVSGAYGSVADDEGFGTVDVTVLDGYRIVNERGRAMLNPQPAVLGVIPVKVFPDYNGDPIIPIVSDYSSREISFNGVSGLLYVVTKPSAPFSEGFISVINGNRVLDSGRNLVDTAHPEVSGALSSLMAGIPVGNDPSFISVDEKNNRVVVTNQAVGALSVLQGFLSE